MANATIVRRTVYIKSGSYSEGYPKNAGLWKQNRVRIWPSCGSKRVELIGNDYWSPEADESRCFEYTCRDCGREWEEEWK